jgi:hypothetical protein
MTSIRHGLTQDDIGKTILVRAIEHVDHQLWLPQQSGIPAMDKDRNDAHNTLRDLEISLLASGVWCCLPWTDVVARCHKALEEM